MALIPPSFLNRVVALGIKSQDGQIKYTATGFLFLYPIEDIGKGRKRGPLFLVTNRHVFQDVPENQAKLLIRFNMPMGLGTLVGAASLKGQDGLPSWTAHPSADVAVLSLDGRQLKEAGIDLGAFAPDYGTITLKQAQEKGISEGNGVFVLGFPLGYVGDTRNYPIVRQGIIARIRDWLHGDSQTFWIDAAVFPGNSGGPVFTKLEFGAISGTKPLLECSLIGMVSSYIQYQARAINQQTGQEMMPHQENSGLGIVVPYDRILETVEAAIKKT